MDILAHISRDVIKNIRLFDFIRNRSMRVLVLGIMKRYATFFLFESLLFTFNVTTFVGCFCPILHPILPYLPSLLYPNPSLFLSYLTALLSSITITSQRIRYCRSCIMCTRGTLSESCISHSRNRCGVASKQTAFAVHPYTLQR